VPRPERASSIAPAQAARVLLVECLDAFGAHAADAGERTRALRAAGAVVRVAVVADSHVTREAMPDGEAREVSESARGTLHVGADAAGLAELERFATDGRFDLALVASSLPGGGAVARRLARRVPVRWWPTGFRAPRAWDEVGRWLGWSGAPALAADPRLALAGISATTASPPAAFDWSSSERPDYARRLLPLWDGEYLLVVGPLAGRAGDAVIAGFSELAEDRPGLDLVVLDEPGPGLDQLARRHGAGWRVHGVGRAPRQAEWAWWLHATSAIVPGTRELSAGLVLRGLVSSCPLAVVAEDSDPLARWLAAEGCIGAPVPAAGAAVASALESLLGRGPEIAARLARAHEVGSRRSLPALATRVASALERRDAVSRPALRLVTRADAAA